MSVATGSMGRNTRPIIVIFRPTMAGNRAGVIERQLNCKAQGTMLGLARRIYESDPTIAEAVRDGHLVGEWGRCEDNAYTRHGFLDDPED